MTAIYLMRSPSILKAKRQVFEQWYQERLEYRIQAKLTSHIVVCHGCELSGEATALALSYQLPVLFLDADYRYLGRLHLESPAQYLPQQLQRASDAEFCQSTAERIVSATLHNRQALLLSLASSCCPTVEIALEAIALFLDEIPNANIEQLRRYFASINQVYYPALREWLWLNAAVEPASVNQFFHLNQALLEQVGLGFVLEMGLDPFLGGLHLSDGENLPLVRDLMLEWSVVLVDRVAMRFALSHSNFLGNGNGNGHGNGNGNGHGHPLTDLITAWEQQLATVATNKKTYRQCLWHQIRHYQRCLCSDTPYRPALLKWTPPAPQPSWRGTQVSEYDNPQPWKLESIPLS